MPESNNNRDVEDVLSSVRRLVSGELPQANRRRSMGAQALVLQPTQRVSKTITPDGRQSLEDRIAELEMQLSSRQDEWEPDGSEDQGQHRPTSVMRMVPPEPEAAEPDDEDDEDVFVLRNEITDADETPEPAPRRQVRRLSRIELIETSPASEDLPEDVTVEEVEDPDRPDEQPTAPESEFDADLASAVAQSVNAALEDLADELAEAESKEEIEDAIDEAAAREIASLDDADDTSADADDMAQTLAPAAALTGRLDGLNAPDTKAPPAPMGKAPDPEPHRAPKPSATPDLADREALRELVGELIREEFQGELGARITRNVRKLVRREIARALATRDLS